MKSQKLVVVCVAMATFALSTTVMTAQEDEQPQLSPEAQAEMEVWMKLAQPGAHHQHLAPFVGTWKGEVKMWMGPETEPIVNESEVEIKSLMDGRYLEWVHTGNFQGMPFEGRAIEGYNNYDKRYESTWIDNFGTLILYYTGTCSDDGKNREMATEFTDPMTGGTIKNRSAYAWIDADHFSFIAYMDKGDGEFKNMEITYARQ